MKTVQVLLSHRRIIAAAVFVMLCATAARAEFVFKKDGAIIEGRILSEGGTSITISTPDKNRLTIMRKDIMRVLYTKLYMGKVFIRMTTGETQEGYVVDEDQDNYYVRKIIDKPDEFTIPRAKVMFIARSNPTDLTGTATQSEITLKWSAPYIPGKKYRIYAKGPKEADFSKLTEVSGTGYTLTNLRSNSSFRIYITSVDGSGVESLPSEQIEVTTLNIPPTVPSNIRKDIITNFDPKKTGIKLSWDESRDVDGKVTEYRIYKQSSDGTDTKIGAAKTSEFFITDADLADTDFVRITSVDNNGTESDAAKYMIGAALEVKTPYIRVRPLAAHPFGKMGKLYGNGFGAAAGLFASGYLFRSSQLGIETGYIYWTGKKDSISKMQMIPLQASIGTHYFLSQRFFFTGSLAAGLVYMSTNYTDAAFQSAKKTGIETIVTGSLSGNYAVSSTLYLFGGLDYSAIWEKGGIKSFAGAHLGAGYRL